MVAQKLQNFRRCILQSTNTGCNNKFFVTKLFDIGRQKFSEKQKIF